MCYEQEFSSAEDSAWNGMRACGWDFWAACFRQSVRSLFSCARGRFPAPMRVTSGCSAHARDADPPSTLSNVHGDGKRVLPKQELHRKGHGSWIAMGKVSRVAPSEEPQR